MYSVPVDLDATLDKQANWRGREGCSQHRKQTPIAINSVVGGVGISASLFVGQKQLCLHEPNQPQASR